MLQVLSTNVDGPAIKNDGIIEEVSNIARALRHKQIDDF